jgi:MFS family permease
MAILAAGVGFALRGGIFGAWASEYGFTASQLGAIGGAGFSGFCFGIIIGGVIVDKIGYGKLVAVALLGHILSAFVTFGASDAKNAYDFLYWGMFIFAFANGTLEAVANPLVATIFPKQRTHYLNILHASWPLGMVVGAVASYLLGSVLGLGWKAQLSFYLVPTIAYAVMFMGQSFPKSEAAEKGASFSEMFKDVGASQPFFGRPLAARAGSQKSLKPRPGKNRRHQGVLGRRFRGGGLSPSKDHFLRELDRYHSGRRRRETDGGCFRRDRRQELADGQPRRGHRDRDHHPSRPSRHHGYRCPP